MRKGLLVLTLAMGVGLAGALLLFAQPTDPWWHPLNPGGSSAGVSYGTQFPSLTTTGANPADGLLFVQQTAGGAADPRLWVYSVASAGWNTFPGTAGLTDNTVPVWNSTTNVLEDSLITDDGTNVVANGTLTAGSAVGAANSITLSGGGIIFEGAANAGEGTLTYGDAGVDDHTYVIPDLDGSATGVNLTGTFIMAVGLPSPMPRDANGIWTEGGVLYWEGALANAFETTLGAIEPTVDNAVYFDDYNANATAAAYYPLMAVSVGTAIPDGSLGIWANAGTLVFEGPGVDAFETVVNPADATVADTIYQLSDHQNTVYPIIAVADNVVPETTSAIWYNVQQQLAFEGATADAWEALISGMDFLGASDVSFIFSLPAAGASGSVLSLTTTVAAMDNVGPDVVDGFLLDLTNADHTGGTLNGLRIDDIVGDAQATEVALSIEAGWDIVLRTDAVPGATTPTFYFADAGVGFIGASAGSWYEIADYGDFFYWQHDTGPANVMSLATVVAAGASGTYLNVGVNYAMQAMDNADAVNVLLVDVANANHSGAGNVLSMIRTDDIAEDPDAFETGLFLGAGMDAHITLTERGGAFADLPPAGSVAIFLDDNADWSGGGGNDCALIAQTSGGATVVVATVVLNGVCP